MRTAAVQLVLRINGDGTQAKWRTNFDCPDVYILSILYKRDVHKNSVTWHPSRAFGKSSPVYPVALLLLEQWLKSAATPVAPVTNMVY
jgi:hypothetical protein